MMGVSPRGSVDVPGNRQAPVKLVSHPKEIDRFRGVSRLGSRLVGIAEDADQPRIGPEPNDRFRRLGPVAWVDGRHVVPV